MDATLAGYLLAAAIFFIFALYLIWRSGQRARATRRVEPRDSTYRAACHEAGHALACRLSSFVGEIALVVLGKGGTGGVLRAQSERCTPAVLWDDMVIRLAGIAAEAQLLGAFFANEARDDIEKAVAVATQLAAIERESSRDFAPPWGAEEMESLAEVGHFISSPVPPQQRRFLNHAFRRALFLVHRDRARLETVAKSLHERGHLSSDDLERLLGPRPRVILGSVPPGPLPAPP